MFALNYEKRPDSGSFLSHPRIKMAIKEQELNHWFVDLASVGILSLILFIRVGEIVLS